MNITRGDLKKLRFKQLDEESELSAIELRTIAELVFETDSFIYPALFDYEDALQIIPKLIEKNSDAMFRKQNLFLAYNDNGAVVGIILWHRGALRWNSSPMMNCAKELGISLLESFQLAEKEYFASYDEDSDVLSIINVCVEESSRGNGIATAMLAAFIAEHPDEELELFTLKDNTPALKLYEGAGFGSVKELPGFSVTEPKPICLQMKRISNKTLLMPLGL